MEEEVTVGARDPRPLVVRNDEPGFLGCHLHCYWASSWMVECGDVYREHPYGEKCNIQENQMETRFAKTTKYSNIQWLVELQDSSYLLTQHEIQDKRYKLLGTSYRIQDTRSGIQLYHFLIQARDTTEK